VRHAGILPSERVGARAYDRAVRPDYPIETERLTLRPFRADDFDALYAMQSNPDVVRYLYWEARDEQQVRDALAMRIAQTELTEPGQWLNIAVVVRESGVLVGDMALRWVSDEHKSGELGYVLHPDHRGHGYATEAAAAMLRLAFTEMKLHRVIGGLDARNKASAAVLERLGMRREAELVENEFVKGEWTSEAIYAILDREWHAKER
jgi:RimJ/RimL family protein N-acetyltransferase